MELSSIRRYPVKSMRGEDLAEAVVEPWGLAGDRRWMVTDEDGLFLTARKLAPLLLITPTLTADGVRLESDGVEPLHVPLPTQDAREVTVWRSTLAAHDAGPAAAAWLSDRLGRPARLVHQHDPTLRSSDPAYSRPGDVVSFADGYPLLLTSESSLAALNDHVLEAAAPDGAWGEPLPMTRFRPNVVVRGDRAWAEDDWRRVRIGGSTFRVVKGCARCVLTTRDPDTGESGKEPLATLARARRWDKQTWFGVNLVPETHDDPVAGTPQPVLRVGDEVEVLDAVEPGGGPLR